MMTAKKAGTRKAAAKQTTRRTAGPMKVRETARGYAFEESAQAEEPPRKKNIRLHQWKIDAARKALGTATETETIEAALDLVVFRQQLADGIRAMQGADLEDVFGADA
jgi:hypothetical protein